jgi:hypothetical protein
VRQRARRRYSAGVNQVGGTDRHLALPMMTEQVSMLHNVGVPKELFGTWQPPDVATVGRLDAQHVRALFNSGNGIDEAGDLEKLLGRFCQKETWLRGFIDGKRLDEGSLLVPWSRVESDGFTVDSDAAHDVLRRGGTLLFRFVDHDLPGARAATRALQIHTGYAVMTHAFVSNASEGNERSAGLGFHVDAEPVLWVQVDGNKVYRTAESLPHPALEESSVQNVFGSVHERVLGPGDWVFQTGRTVHSAATPPKGVFSSGELSGRSVHLVFMPQNHLLSHVVSEALRLTQPDFDATPALARCPGLQTRIPPRHAERSMHVDGMRYLIEYGARLLSHERDVDREVCDRLRAIASSDALLPGLNVRIYGALEPERTFADIAATLRIGPTVDRQATKASEAARSIAT